MAETEVRVGARLRCESCGTEVVVVRAGASAPTCCGEPLEPFGAGAAR